MSAFNCPKCGATLKVIPLAGAGAGWERGQEFAFGSGKMPAGAAEFSRERPVANMANIESGARLPLVQAGITSGAAMLLAVVGCWYWSWAWSVVPVVGVVVGCLAWYLLLLQSRSLLSTRETALADPSASEKAFNVEITIPRESGNKMIFAQFDAKPPHVQRFAQAAVDGRLTVYGGHGLSRGVYERLRDESLDRGLLSWKRGDHHASGVELTRAGGHVFRRLSDSKTA